MFTPLQSYTADHRYVLQTVARQTGLADPVAVDLDEFAEPLFKAARKGEYLPLDGVLVRDWDPDVGRNYPGMQFGMRVYEIEGIRFVKVQFRYDDQQAYLLTSPAVVDRKNYLRLYRIALRCRRDAEPPSTPPILPPDQAAALWKNTIAYLEPRNLRRLKAFGGRPRRGVLLTGAPGNGKTMACRWIWEECRRRHWDWRLVTPDTYRQARRGCNPQEAVQELFRVDCRGIVFFDDMDLALRDRETVEEKDDQAVFLSAMDGLNIVDGVVYVFTTNCALELIDRAFKRPGRLDVVLHFALPNEDLRRRLIQTWHEEIRGGIDSEQAVGATEGYSFAEIEELKNLLILHNADSGVWDWSVASKQFEINRMTSPPKPSAA
jgi:hypothetical protein